MSVSLWAVGKVGGWKTPAKALKKLLLQPLPQPVHKIPADRQENVLGSGLK